MTRSAGGKITSCAKANLTGGVKQLYVSCQSNPCIFHCTSPIPNPTENVSHSLMQICPTMSPHVPGEDLHTSMGPGQALPQVWVLGFALFAKGALDKAFTVSEIFHINAGLLPSLVILRLTHTTPSLACRKIAQESQQYVPLLAGSNQRYGMFDLNPAGGPSQIPDARPLETMSEVFSLGSLGGSETVSGCLVFASLSLKLRCGCHNQKDRRLIG